MKVHNYIDSENQADHQHCQKASILLLKEEVDMMSFHFSTISK